MKKQIEIPLQVRVAQITAPNKAARTVELVWSTGASVRRFNWWLDQEWIEELSLDPAHVRMDRLNNGAPLLNAHARWELSDIIGVTEKAWLANNEGRAVVRFSARDEVAPIWQDVEDKIIRNVSVGYIVHRMEDISTPEDKKDRVARMRVVDWEPHEISLVPVGADAGSGVRSERGDRAPRHTCEIEIAEPVSAGNPESQQAGRAAPPATRGLDLLRRRLELAARY